MVVDSVCALDCQSVPTIAAHTISLWGAVGFATDLFPMVLEKGKLCWYVGILDGSYLHTCTSSLSNIGTLTQMLPFIDLSDQ